MRAAAPSGCGVDPEQRVGRFDRRVRSESESSAGPLQRSPCVCVRSDRGPLGVSQLAVGNRMDRLHRRDHANGCKALLVFRMHALRMLDARTPLAPCAPARLQGVKCSPYRAVTDCVEAYVELGADAALDHVDELTLREPHGSRAVQTLSSPT